MDMIETLTTIDERCQKSIKSNEFFDGQVDSLSSIGQIVFIGHVSIFGSIEVF